MKFKPTHLLCLSLSLCFFTSELKAQEPTAQYFIPAISPKSPNSTEFGKYGDYPVNLYSGLPEISIPLYTVQSGGISIPITLSYHASGIKVDDAPGWVGAGWSINTAGMISRKVMGMPDEGFGGYLSGTWENSTALNAGLVNDAISYCRSVISTRGNSSFDTRPDIYSYDIPGHSGKFFYNTNDGKKIEKVPFAPLEITGYPDASFKIRDEHGTIFLLGQTASEQTLSSDDHSSGFSAITGWMLEKMISQNRRDTIAISYQQQVITEPPQTGQWIQVDDQLQTLGGTNDGCPITYLSPIQTTQNNNYATVHEQDISQIKFKNGMVQFKLSPKRRTDLHPYNNQTIYPLDTIKVLLYNYALKKYEVQKSIKFYTSYYTTATSDTGRLRLDSIQIWDKAGSTVQHYRFDYNNQPTAHYYSFSKDYWGFYNGKMNGNPTPTLIPQTKVTYQPNPLGTPTIINIGSSDSTSRNPDSTFMQAGVLKTIHYPTGGYTTFAYQTNRYYDVHGVMYLAGGLRVDTISSYDGISPTPIIKTYRYNASRVSGPTIPLTGLLNYGFFINTSSAVCYVNTSGPAQAYEQKNVRTYYSEPAASLTPTDGNPVVYSNVTEYIGTPGANIGKTEYQYRDALDYWDGTTPTTGVPVIQDYFFYRGQLLAKIDSLKKPDGTYQIVKAQLNTYTQFSPLTYYNDVGLVVGQRKITDGVITIAQVGQQNINDQYRFPYSDYGIVSDDNYLTSSSTITYDTSDPTKYVTSTTNYGYDDTTHLQPVVISRNDSKGNTRKTTSNFAYNYVPTGQTLTGNAVLDTMINEHIFAEPIEKTETYTSSSGTTTTGSQLNVYKFGSLSGSIVPSTISVLNIASPVTNFTPSTVTAGSLTKDSRYTQMISFDQYDPKNNILQYTPRNSTPVSIVWDYMYDLPTAQIKNALNTPTGSQVFYTGFESPRQNGWYYTGAPLYDVTTPNGGFSYPLGAGSVSLSSGSFDNTKSYVLSLWSNNGAPTVTAGSALTGTPLRTALGWTYYEYTVPASVTSITISGSTSIDELRMYPIDAQMTTYTYDPSGLRAIVDTKGQTSFFEYDFAQRLKNIKDWNGNIVKNFGYHNYDMTVGNDAIGATTFTRDNCPTGTSPQTTTYSVAANKYLSSTKSSANAEAQYDLKVNGQLKADNPANCGCPVTTVAFTLTNSTGISGFTANFSGLAPFNFPASGSTIVQVPVGLYSTLTAGPVGTQTHTFKLDALTQSNVHSATFTNVLIATSGSTGTTLTIQ